jgi:hypothetical protein
MNAEKYTCMMFMSLSSVVTSFGFLGIFLYMQPHAYDHFKAMMRCTSYTESINQDKDNEEEVDAGMTGDETERKIPKSKQDGNKSRSPNPNRDSHHHSNMRKSLKVATNVERDSLMIDRDSLHFSFYDLRTDEELMDWMEDEFSITDDSIFAPSCGNISLQTIKNPVYKEDQHVTNHVYQEDIEYADNIDFHEGPRKDC